MRYALEQIIDDMRDSVGYTELGYSGGQSVDRKYCPICGADDVIRYQTDQVITMDTLDHSDSCMYSLVRKLEKELENDITIEDLTNLKSNIREDLDSARFPSAKEYNDGLDRGTDIAIDRIELLEDLISDDEY